MIINDADIIRISIIGCILINSIDIGRIISVRVGVYIPVPGIDGAVIQIIKIDAFVGTVCTFAFDCLIRICIGSIHNHHCIVRTVSIHSSIRIICNCAICYVIHCAIRIISGCFCVLRHLGFSHRIMDGYGQFRKIYAVLRRQTVKIRCSVRCLR